MVVTDFDPNRECLLLLYQVQTTLIVDQKIVKYVALLAFSRIVVSYPHLVSMHQDAIMNCLEDADISIRLQALELAARMVTEDNLQFVVDRLIGQLETLDPTQVDDVEYAMESGEYVEPKQARNDKASISVSEEYRVEVLHRILDICSYDNYSRMDDFEWYVGTLIRLVKHLPTGPEKHTAYQNDGMENAASRIGLELRNIAVRVRNVRMEATRAAEYLLLIDNRHSLFAYADSGILGPLAWVAGEYAEYLSSPGQTLQSLIDVSNTSSTPRTLSLFIQAAPKVLTRIIRDYGEAWSAAQKSEISLYLARTVEFLEHLAAHPDLDVQERAIEFLEIMRLAADVVRTGTQEAQIPYLLSSVIPSLFFGLELNPVAPNAQKKVPIPDQLSLDIPFNSNIRALFEHSQDGSIAPPNEFYYAQESHSPSKHQSDIVTSGIPSSLSYQTHDIAADSADSAGASLAQKVEWRQRNRDDPFYIGKDGQHNTAAIHGGNLDLDSIPIVDLKIGSLESNSTPFTLPHNSDGKQPKKYEVIPDEVIGLEETLSVTDEPVRAKRTLLQVDSSGLRDFTLSGENQTLHTRSDKVESIRVEDDMEMATAMKEVERIRLEMQRASERVHLEGTPSDGTLVKRKKKTKKSGHKTRGTDSGRLEEQKSSSGQKKSRIKDRVIEG
jgi:AP-3 complex subunit delta-1